MADINAEKSKTFADIIKEYGLSDEQVEFIQAYSRKRTTTRFEKRMAEEIGDPEMIKNWRYEGYHDCGYHGAGKCSLGHKLRYEHFARNVHTKEQIVFGIKCVTDFFKLTPLALKLIRQGFNEANNEIKESLEKFIKYGSFEKYNEKFDIVNQAEYVIENHNNQLCRPGKDVFEESLLIGELMGFLSMKLPIPNWFEDRIRQIYRREMHRFSTRVDNDPEYKESIVKAKRLLGNANFKNNHSQAYQIIKDMLTKLRQTSQMSQPAKAYFDKMVSMEWDVLDPMIVFLKPIQRNQFLDAVEFDFVQKAVSNYEKFGLTEKQANWIKKIHGRLSQPSMQKVL